MKAEDVAMFFETSSKTAVNVSKAFDEVAKQLFLNQLEKRRIPIQEGQQPKEKQPEIKLKTPQPKKK